MGGVFGAGLGDRPDRWRVSCPPSTVHCLNWLFDEPAISARGGATKTAPSRWSDDDLASVFRTEYTKEIPTYYPYDAENSNDTDPSVPSIITVQPSADGGLPAWAGAVIGVLVGLAVIGAAVVFFLLWRRRKARRESYVSDSTQERGIMRWLSKTPSHVDGVARTHTEVTSTQGNTETDPYERDTSETIVSPSSPSPPPVMRNSFPQELDCELLIFSLRCFQQCHSNLSAKHSEYCA